MLSANSHVVYCCFPIVPSSNEVLLRREDAPHCCLVRTKAIAALPCLQIVHQQPTIATTGQHEGTEALQAVDEVFVFGKLEKRIAHRAGIPNGKPPVRPSCDDEVARHHVCHLDIAQDASGMENFLESRISRSRVDGC